jgi:hypothetical protein
MTEDLQCTIENSVTGERVTFLATAEKTNGEYLRIRNETSAGASQDRLKWCDSRPAGHPSFLRGRASLKWPRRRWGRLGPVVEVRPQQRQVGRTEAV